ncbi:hypothetical protein OG474_25485 [Kribbella sp. NBC_01505]|uniref:hypothetical protein n=1 Tax=Kribbella sp. NBC_01505 TaxID=2903580 RepID=UPI0038700BC7
MRIFNRPTDPTEAVLRRLAKRLRWFRPSLADAPTPSEQLAHLAQHKLCPAIDKGDPAPLVTAFAIVEEALASAELTEATDGALIDLIEVVSNWTSWPETPPEVVAAIDAAIGPATRERRDRVHRQAAVVTDWLRAGDTADREAPATYQAVKNADLRFLVRSNKQYIDETLAVDTADRLRHEMATGQGM